MTRKLLIPVVVLSFLVQFCVTESAQSERWSDVTEVLPRAFLYVNPPSPYETYVWGSGCDFAYLRDVKIPVIKGLNVVAWSTLGAVIGAAAGGAAGVSIGIGTGQALPAGMQYFSDSIGNFLSAGTEWSWGTWVWPVRLSEVINRLDSELGISDYYVFADVEPGKILGSGATLPLGAWVKLDFNLSDHQRSPGTLYEREKRVAGLDPLVFRLSNGELDFDKIDARVYERDLSGKDRPVTIDRVFTYEYFQGRKIPKGSQDKTHQMLRVLRGHPDPEHGGKIIGKAELKYLPGVGISGLREIHLSSPVNDGLLFKEGDALAFAINLDTNTVTVEGNSSASDKPKVNEELAIRVFVKGLHNPPVSYVDASDGGHYLWKDIAAKVFDDSKCEGAGVTDTQIQHDEQFTMFRCTPTESGDVYVALQTIDGPVRFKAASIEPDAANKDISSYKYWAADRPYIGTYQEDAKIPIPGISDFNFFPLIFTYYPQSNIIYFNCGFMLIGSGVVHNYFIYGTEFYHPDHSTNYLAKIKAKVDPAGKFKVKLPDKNRHALVTLEGQLSSDFMTASGVIRVVYHYDYQGNPISPPGIKLEARWQAKVYEDL